MHTYYENSPSEKGNSLQIQINFVSSIYFSIFTKISNRMLFCIAQVDLKECFPSLGTNMRAHAQTLTHQGKCTESLSGISVCVRLHISELFFV